MSDMQIEIDISYSNPGGNMDKLLLFLNKLEVNDIFYKLSKVRDSILVEVAVPGQRWEVD